MDRAQTFASGRLRHRVRGIFSDARCGGMSDKAGPDALCAAASTATAPLTKAPLPEDPALKAPSSPAPRAGSDAQSIPAQSAPTPAITQDENPFRIMPPQSKTESKTQHKTQNKAQNKHCTPPDQTFLGF